MSTEAQPGRIPLARSMALAACGLSLGASLWALIRPTDCGACEAVWMAGAGPAIPLAGTVWYALILGLILRRGLDRAAAACACAACGVHLGLVALMAWKHEWCVPCLLAATGALLLFGITWQQRIHSRWVTAVLVITMAAVCCAIVFPLSAQQRFRLQFALEDALQRARGLGPVVPGKVELVYFRREGCRHCQYFDGQVLPQLKRDFGDKLVVIPTTAWPALPAPTLVIRGQHDTVDYVNVSYDTVRKVIAEELAE